MIAVIARMICNGRSRQSQVTAILNSNPSLPRYRSYLTRIMDILYFPDFVRGTVKSSDTDTESSEVTVRILTLVATSGADSGSLPGHSECSSEQVLLNAKATKRLPTRRPQIRVYQVQLSNKHDVPCGIAVCKIAWDPCIPSLAHEVETYQTNLKLLQGTVVPRFTAFTSAT